MEGEDRMDGERSVKGRSEGKPARKSDACRRVDYFKLREAMCSKGECLSFSFFFFILFFPLLLLLLFLFLFFSFRYVLLSFLRQTNERRGITTGWLLLLISSRKGRKNDEDEERRSILIHNERRKSTRENYCTENTTQDNKLGYERRGEPATLS